jgi:hypothetical protein
MKTAIKLTTVILAMAMMAGWAWAQNPDAIDNARSIAKSLQQKQANDTNAALDAAGVVAPSSKPAPGAPAPAVKPAVIPGSSPAAAAPKPAAAAPKPAAAAPKPAAVAPKPVAAPAKPVVNPAPPATKATASTGRNQLHHVEVSQASDGVHVEISTSAGVTPRLTKLDSPARVLVELPETVVATPKNRIPFGSAGVKGVRIGMDGKEPPTTSVVVDLEKAVACELVPGGEGKIVLALHTQGGAPAGAKNSAPARSAAPAAQPPAAQSKTVAAKPATPAPNVAAVKDSKPAKPAAPPAKQEAKATAPAKPAPPAAKPATDTKAAAAKPAAPPASAPAADAAKNADASKQPKPEDKKWAMNGKRDPFFSPVVQQGGSGCSTGKKCLEIGNINLRGVVKSDSGFIAVVTNNLNKAYFLRENDPVFNGYVVKITGDSVVFQETIQDKLGKPFTREVVKRIFTPAV